MRASPLSLSRTRWKRGLPSTFSFTGDLRAQASYMSGGCSPRDSARVPLLAQPVADEAPYLDVLADLLNVGRDMVLDGDARLLHERLLVEAGLRVELRHPALDDLVQDVL